MACDGNFLLRWVSGGCRAEMKWVGTERVDTKKRVGTKKRSGKKDCGSEFWIRYWLTRVLGSFRGVSGQRQIAKRKLTFRELRATSSTV